jgi:hypothetical protein
LTLSIWSSLVAVVQVMLMQALAAAGLAATKQVL